MSRTARLLRSASSMELGVLAVAAVTIVVTWIILGWTPAVAITQYDGSTLVAPYVQGALAGGADWTHNLYRFGVIGGSEMHPFAGTMPVLQLCALLGLTTTATVNVIVIVVQVCYAFLGYKLITSWMQLWSPPGVTPRPLTVPQWVVIVWTCSFAPLLGWRLGIGHDNLLIGVLPMLAALTLLTSARAGTLTITALVIAAFSTMNGITGLGAQTVIYGTVFGAPVVLVTIFGDPRGARWGRAQWVVVAVLLGAVLVAMPRLIGMIHHAIGEDASRGLGESVTYSFGANTAVDWLASLTWVRELGDRLADTKYPHEHNYPVGPLVLFLIVAWPRGVGRGVLWALLGSAAFAIAFADDLRPVSTGLIAVIKPLAAFRVPARAFIPLPVPIPPLALAALWTPREPPGDLPARRVDWVPWLALLVSAKLITVFAGHVPAVREPLAWLMCAGLAVLARSYRRDAVVRYAAPLIAVVAALGVAGFADRLMPEMAPDTIEGGPRRLHDATLAQAPELRTALDRVMIANPEWMYNVSNAFAANLPSLDGVWYPPQRFLALFSALTGRTVPATTCVFNLARTPWFPVLQQLYNVKYVVDLGAGTAAGSIGALTDTVGAAWFPTAVERVDTAAPLSRAFADVTVDLRAAVKARAWLLRSDAAHLPAQTAGFACGTGVVKSVVTDSLGQTATLEVRSPADCPLIVATNYVTALHAVATTGGVAHELAVFPIDIALTGIEVPPGDSTIVLAPRADIPTWTWGAWALGVALFGFAIVDTLRRRRVTT